MYDPYGTVKLPETWQLGLDESDASRQEANHPIMNHPETPITHVAPMRHVEIPKRQREIHRPDLDNTPPPMLQDIVDTP